MSIVLLDSFIVKPPEGPFIHLPSVTLTDYDLVRQVLPVDDPAPKPPSIKPRSTIQPSSATARIQYPGSADWHRRLISRLSSYQLLSSLALKHHPLTRRPLSNQSPAYPSTNTQNQAPNPLTTPQASIPGPSSPRPHSRPSFRQPSIQIKRLVSFFSPPPSQNQDTTADFPSPQLPEPQPHPPPPPSPPPPQPRRKKKPRLNRGRYVNFSRPSYKCLNRYTIAVGFGSHAGATAASNNWELAVAVGAV